MEGDRYGTNPLYGGCQAYPPFPGLLRRELAPVRICALRFLQNSGILQTAGLFVSSGSGGEALYPPHEGCRLLFARLPEPTECAGALTMEQFISLYRLYLEKEGLLDAPCLPEALLRLQEAACYDW